LVDFVPFNNNSVTKEVINYNVEDSTTSYNNILSNSFSESNNSPRFSRFSNLLISYDYKTGNYIGNWDKQYPYLMLSFIEVARGIRKPT
jgi:hypothetical protein